MFFFVFYLLNAIFRNEVMHVLNEKLKMQENLGQIMFNLDQSIFSVMNNKFSYINKVGIDIIQKIK